VLCIPPVEPLSLAESSFRIVGAVFAVSGVHTFSSLLGDLVRLGIQPHDCLLVHSSMKAIGEVQGGADTVLDVLQHHLAGGLLLLPTHTWSDSNNLEGIFDPSTERSCVGILTEHFRQRPGVIRSWHPTHSMAGCGGSAAAFLAGEEHTRTPCPRNGCWGRLYDGGARILFLGASLRTNTFLHSVEEWRDIPDRLAAQPTPFRIRTPEGTLIDCPQNRHFSSVGDVSQHFGKVESELLQLGIVRDGRVGDARSLLGDARAMADFVGNHLQRDPGFFASS
jgi:aminoglycoside 3-N-acetyltransferase